MDFDSLSEWSKWLEKNFSPEIMIPKLPVILRLDGNNFSSYTRNLNKPFDEGFNNLMVSTLVFLVKETNAIIGYCGSDEITLILYSDDPKSKIYHNGKKQKILSKLSAKCVVHFNKERKKFLPNHDRDGIFDCRIYQVPTLTDGYNQLLWRENDVTRNSVSMLGQSLYTHNELNGVSTSGIHDMLMEKGVNWNDIPVTFKRGTYVRRTKIVKSFTVDELNRLPPNHDAHKDPKLKIERNVISKVELPIFSTIKNKLDVVFNGADPITY